MASVVQTFAVTAGALGPISFSTTGTLGDTIGTSAAASANTEYPMAVNFTNLQSIFLYTDGDLDITTNAENGSGGQNFTVTSGIPFFWYVDSGITNPINTDITAWWWHNASNAAINVYGIINQDV